MSRPPPAETKEASSPARAVRASESGELSRSFRVPQSPPRPIPQLASDPTTTDEKRAGSSAIAAKAALRGSTIVRGTAGPPKASAMSIPRMKVRSSRSSSRIGREGLGEPARTWRTTCER